MNSPQGNHHESGAFMAWGVVVGCVLGLVIGWIARHPCVGAIGAGALGLVTGALIDRSRH